MTPRHSGDAGLWLIGGFKLAKGLLLLAVGVGILRLLHQDVAGVLASWIAQLHVDPENRYVDRALSAIRDAWSNRLSRSLR